MTFKFTKATKEQAKARIAIVGPSGSGKTYTSLKLAQEMGDNVALIDTENGSASKYADEFDFSTLNLLEFSPQTYVEAIKSAEQAGFDVLIVDSLSHAWAGKGGALQMVDNAAKRYQGNSFAAWRDVTPHHNDLVDALVQCGVHLIVTMRAKTEYVVQKNDKGKMEPRKIGLAPVQRDGLEYEFDILADMDLDHNLIVSKTRCKALDNQIFSNPGQELADIVVAWLTDGEKPRIVHWSEQPHNREKLENTLTSRGISIETLFRACEVEDWTDMTRYEGTGQDALTAAKDLWKKEKANSPEPVAA